MSLVVIWYGAEIGMGNRARPIYRARPESYNEQLYAHLKCPITPQPSREIALRLQDQDMCVYVCACVYICVYVCIIPCTHLLPCLFACH